MSDRPFSPVTGQPFKVQNYYFQIIPFQLKFQIQPVSRTVKYVFSVFKGSKKFETSKEVTLFLDAMKFPLEGIRLNFVVINYNPSRSENFDLRISEVYQDKEKQVGEFRIDGNTLIDNFLKNQNGAFQLEAPLNEFIKADLYVYVEKSRYGVERLIKDIKNSGSKGPEDKQIIHQTISFSEKAPIRTEQFLPEEQVIRVQPTYTKDDYRPLSKTQGYNQKLTPLKQTQQEQYIPIQQKGRYSQPLKKNKPEALVMLKSETFPINLAEKAPVEEPKRSRPRKVEIQPKWYEQLPFNIKFAVPILLLVLAGIYFSFSSEQTPQPLFPKATSQKIISLPKKTKSKRAKK